MATEFTDAVLFCCGCVSELECNFGISHQPYHFGRLYRETRRLCVVAGGHQHQPRGPRKLVLIDQRRCCGGEGLPVARCILSTLCSYWYEDNTEDDKDNSFSKGRCWDHGVVERPRQARRRWRLRLGSSGVTTDEDVQGSDPASKLIEGGASDADALARGGRQLTKDR